MSDWKVNDLVRYQRYTTVLKRPTFASVDDARQNMRVAEGKFRRFIVREPLGVYRVYYAFINTPRDGEPQWACNEEYSFSHAELHVLRNRAALAVGLDLVDSMG